MRLRVPAPVLRIAMPVFRGLMLYPGTALALRRGSVDLIIGNVPRPRGSTARRGRVGGIPALRIDPGRQPDPREGAILYLHGGGYVVGSARSHRPIATRLALGTGLPVLVPDYRTAPEHPFPAALDDALAAWRALRAGGTPAERIVLAGYLAAGDAAVAALVAAINRQDSLGAL